MNKDAEKSETVSIIVCTKDRPEGLARLWNSINCQIRQPDELVIVDASGDDKTCDLVRCRAVNLPYPVRFHKMEAALPKQRNAGFRFSKGDYILFLDDDTILEENYIEIIARTFLARSDVAGITGQITNSNQEQGGMSRLIKKWCFLNDQGKGRMKLSGFPEHCKGDSFTLVKVCSGACMSYRRRVLDEFQFDERLDGYAYMEDVDFSFRVSRRYCLAYQPLAKVAHLPTTYRTVDAQTLRRMLARNHAYLFRKNQAKDVAHIYAFIMSILGLLIYNAVLNRNLRGCLGVLQGLRDSLRMRGAKSCASA